MEQRGMFRSIIASSFCMASVLVAGCDAAPGSGVSERAGTVTQGVISDQNHQNGTVGFAFLPPIVPGTGNYGTFLPNLPVTVRVDELNQDGTTLRSLATFTTESGPGGERLGMQFQNGTTAADTNASGYYYARWLTNDANLSPAALYRIRVLVPDTGGRTRELGYSDVDVVATTGEFRTVDRQNFAPLLNGTTLRINFRVDRAAVDRDRDGIYDWLDNCPTMANPNQADSLGNGVGDACRCATVKCTRQDACHLVGTCQPETGVCTNPVVRDGVPCRMANADAVCTAGVCTLKACYPRSADCNANPSDGCETRLNSPQNCGSCGRVCAAGPNSTALCRLGQCSLDCAPDYADCDRTPETGCERNIASDRANCGACGRVCANDEDCVAGACTKASCPVGHADCNNVATDGCEVDLTTDVNHCGSCSARCELANATATCSTGACAVAQCNAGYADCNGVAADGCETELVNDVNNCGVCQNRCAAAHASSACIQGACVVLSCNVGFADCDGQSANGCETALASDASNCGVCGNSCAAPNGTPACASGVCGILTCNPGYLDCNAASADGCEVDVRSNPVNCGTCGNACPAAPNTSATCSQAVCGLACNAGFADCDGQPANGCETDLQGHCGTCECKLPHAIGECLDGQCGFSVCETGYADCDGQVANGCEVDLATNCGACQPNCDDGNPCTVDACSGSTCSHTDRTPSLCPIENDCSQSSRCYAVDAQTAACEYTHSPDGTRCKEYRDFANMCKTWGTCQAGACTGVSDVVCSGGPRECYSGPTCNPQWGECEYTVSPTGTPCANLPCMVGGWCSMGYCRGVMPAPDGWTCENGNACDGSETCLNGSCGAGAPLPDGSSCGDGLTCSAGVCG